MPFQCVKLHSRVQQLFGEAHLDPHLRRNQVLRWLVYPAVKAGGGVGFSFALGSHPEKQEVAWP